MSLLITKLSEYCTLPRLQRYLNVNLTTSWLFVIMLFWGFAFVLIELAAVAFTVFMMIVLYQERRFGWIAAFPLVVLGPALGIHYLGIPQQYDHVLTLLPLVLFYLYCFFLKLSIPEWED